MSRKLICLISLVSLLAMAGNASGDLVAHWTLDEGSGSVVNDASGNGHDGSIGGTPNWVAGQVGGALDFDGSSNYIDMDDRVAQTTFSLAMWLKPRDIPYSSDYYAIMHTDTWSPGGLHLHLRVNTSIVDGDIQGGGPRAQGTTALQENEWYHVVLTVDASGDRVSQLYIDGVLDGTGTGGAEQPFLGPLNFGAWTNNSRYYHGLMDDIRIYDHVLSEAEIKELSARPRARRPIPADGDFYLDTWVSCQWTPGDFAASHDVYFGENFADVEAGTGGTFRGNKLLGTEYYIAGLKNFDYPAGLVPGTTYYWRIDEVEPDGTIQKGNVWSFSIPSNKAHEPVPGDGSRFVETDVTLTWTPGFAAVFHYVYFGDNAADVEAGTGDTDKGQFLTESFVPGTLERDKTYYWRVDELDEDDALHTGEVWSFRTMPEMPVTDPNLVAWWKLDEGSGNKALDWSGHDHHATIGGTSDFVPGYDGDALDFDGSSDYIDVGERLVTGSYSLTMWIRPRDIPYSSGFYAVLHNDAWNAGSLHVHLRNTTSLINADINAGPGVESATALQADQWYHCALTVATEGGNASQLYINGVLEATGSGGDGTPYLGPLNFGAWTDNQRFYHGLMDDIRIYDKVLTADEVQQTMRGDPLLAWDPSPTNGSVPDVHEAASISWSPGDEASQHDVYFGTDRNAVTDADTATTGIYRGRQSGTSYTPPEGVEWGGGPYYWRIDEYNTDGTISKGRVWSFSVADFIGIDDFEDYKGDEVSVTEQIWGVWRDGLGYGAVAAPPYYPGNGTGSEVGDVATTSYTEETIYHDGFQSMPYVYNNNKPDKFKYSEAKMTLTAPRDWTAEGVKSLSLWFQGYPASTGSLTVAGNTYTMTGSGADIWNIGPGEGEYGDQFHYAYKQLTGAGTITAKVESVAATHDWAKAGVMIRDTLEPGSKHAFACVTPASGVSFQGRRDAGAGSFSTAQAGITAPHWVRLERDLSGNFTVYHSADGSTWDFVENSTPEAIQMNTNVYIGLAVTAHNQGNPVPLTCEAVFSGVQITGNVSGQWASQDIGIESNDAERMYVAVANNTGLPGVVYHDDPAAAQIDTLTEWNIDLKDFADKGINLADVNSIAIGFGDRDNPTAGGSGKMYFDDISLYRPRCVPDKVTLSAADLNGDCVVDMADLELMVDDWLAGEPDLAADLNADSTVDFEDYAALAEAWLEEQLWPEW